MYCTCIPFIESGVGKILCEKISCDLYFEQPFDAINLHLSRDEFVHRGSEDSQIHKRVKENKPCYRAYPNAWEYWKFLSGNPPVISLY